MKRISYPEISIIVPVHNAESYIINILSDIKNQVFSDYEVVIVNDGSTDRTEELANRFVDNDARFILVSQENKGVSAARNKGLEIAKGNYVTFFDVDDRVPNNALRDMFECIMQNGTDMVVGLYEMVRIDEAVIPSKLAQLVNNGAASYLSWEFLYNFSVWNKLFKKNIIDDNGISFMKIGVLEDGVFLFQYLCHSNTISTCNSIVYKYIKHRFNESSSLSSLKTQSLIKDRLKAFSIIQKTVEEKYNQQITYIDDEIQRNQLEESYIIWTKQFYIRCVFVLLRKYYRFIWELSDESCLIIMDAVKNYKDKLSDMDWADHVFKKNKDIISAEDNLLISRSTMIDTPIVSIVITSNVPQYCIEEIIARIYNQMLTSFEVIVDERHSHTIHNKWGDRLNFRYCKHIRGLEKFIKSAINDAKGSFVYIIDEPIYLSNATLLKAWRELTKKRNLKKGFISMPLYNRLNEPNKRLLTSQYAFTDTKVSRNDLSICDCVWGNKLFRIQTIKKVLAEYKTFGKKQSQLFEQLYNSIPFIQASDKYLFTEITDETIIRNNSGRNRKKRIKEILNTLRQE